MITIFNTSITVISFILEYGSQQCILGMGNLTGYVHVPVKSISINTFRQLFCWLVLLRLGEMSEFRVVHDEPMLILLVGCKIDRDGLERSRKVDF